MRAALIGSLAVVLLIGCDTSGGGGMGALDGAVPEHGIDLFRNSSDGTETDVHQEERSALLRIGDEVLAAYGYGRLNGGPGIPTSYVWVDVAVARGFERGTRWVAELFHEDPDRPGSPSYFSQETVRFRRSRGQVHVLPVTYSPIFYSVRHGAWMEMPHIPAAVDCDGAADEEHDLYFQSCREFRSLRVTGQAFEGEASFSVTTEEYAADMLTAVDPAEGPAGTLYLAVIPHVSSEAPRLHALDAEAAQRSEVGSMELVGELPDCDGTELARLRAYEIIDGRHHLVAEGVGAEAAPPLFHIVGTPTSGFTCQRVAGGADGGAFRSLQVPTPGDGDDRLVLILEHGTDCVQGLATPLDSVAWEDIGSAATGLAVNPESAVVWPDGRLGFLSGQSVAGYYQVWLDEGLSCSDVVTPPAGGADAGAADVTGGFATEGNRIVIVRTRQFIDVEVEHVDGGGVNPICGVQTVDHTGSGGCDSGPEPQASCAVVEGFVWQKNVMQYCYNVPLELRFADANERFPGIDLPAVAGVIEAPANLGNETQYIYKGDPFTMTWEVEPGWDEMVIQITAEGETEPFYSEATEDDGEHTLPASVFDSIPHFAYVDVALRRTRAIPFPFPVAEGSSATAVQELLYLTAQFRVEERQ